MIPIQPKAAEIAGALNEFGKGAGFYDIAIGSAGITASDILLVIRCAEDDNRDGGKPRVSPEPFQKIAAVLAAKVKVQKNERRERGRVA